MDQYSLIYILRRTEREGVTWGHLYSALLLFGKGHIPSHELSIELLGNGGGGGRKRLNLFSLMDSRSMTNNKDKVQLLDCTASYMK